MIKQHLLIGFSMEELGAAVVRYRRITSIDPPKTFKGASNVINWWMSRYPNKPLEISFDDVKQELDMAWAIDTFCSAMDSMSRGLHG
jgi:hypothetical protein